MATRSCWLPPAALDRELEEGLTGEEPMLGVVTLQGGGGAVGSVQRGWGEERVVVVVRLQPVSAALSILSQIPAAKVRSLAL